MDTPTPTLNELQQTIKILRSDEGCPWDKKQTPLSLQKYLKEEVAELLEAIHNNNSHNICEEIGDVVYVLAMIAEFFNEKDSFSFNDCILGINKKLIRRHPHVFGDTTKKTNKSEAELREQWENIKREEKKEMIDKT